MVERLAQAGIPVVLVDEHTADAEVCTVSVDDVEGGHLAVAHLLAQGRRRIGFVAGPLATRQVADRLAERAGPSPRSEAPRSKSSRRMP